MASDSSTSAIGGGGRRRGAAAGKAPCHPAMLRPGDTGAGAPPGGFFEDEDWSSSDSPGWVAAPFFRFPIASSPPVLCRHLPARIDRVPGAVGGVCWVDWCSSNRETNSESGSTSESSWEDCDELQSDPSEQSWDWAAPPIGSSPWSPGDGMQATGDELWMPAVRCCLHRWRV